MIEVNSVDCVGLSVLEYCIRKEQESYHGPKNSEGVFITDPAQMKASFFGLSFLIGMGAMRDEASDRLITAQFY